MPGTTDTIIISGKTLSLKMGDITREAADAIVNAANSNLMGGGGVDGAIHRAGGPAIVAECREIVGARGRLPAGQAVITTGGNLPAKYVIHTVGPIWHDGVHGEAELLASAYRQSLELMAENRLRTVAFPSVSTGAYGYPVEKAAKVALGTVASFLGEETTSVESVVFVLFSEAALRAYQNALSGLD